MASADKNCPSRRDLRCNPFRAGSKAVQESNRKGSSSRSFNRRGWRGERGGTHGVVRKLMVLRDLAEDHLSPQGKPVYNVIGLFDNDTAGRKAVIGAKHWDASILEYRDVFRLHPIMPKSGSLDLGALQRNFLALNAPHKSLDWELEDLIGRALITRFLAEYQTALVRSSEVAGQIHYELTRDGKSRLVRFCKEHADISSMQGLIEVLHALRFYQRLPPLQ